MKSKLRVSSLATRLAAAALLGATLAGCAPLIVGGMAAGGALMVTDRRTSGAQVDDEAIQLRANSRLQEALGDQAHVSVNSYNRQVLLTGEVPTDAARQQAEQIAGRVDNVRGVTNELIVGPPSSLPQRSSDLLITGQVRAGLVDAQDLAANAFRVVTEHGTVYLMGRVTPGEAERATNIARSTSGVNKVVRMFELVTVQDLRDAGVTPPTAAYDHPPTAASAAPAPAAMPAAAPTAPATEAGGAVATPIR